MQLSELITSLVTNPQLNADIIRDGKKEYSKVNKISGLPSNMQMLKTYRDLIASGDISQHKTFEQLLKKRAIRSQSGIVSVQVLTKPFRCPGKCIFCPNDFTMPKSYINTEPGAMRALLNNFDPIKQVYNRLLSLTLTGHETDKIEMIVLGGTRDVYPDDYKIEFVKGLYDACNTFPEFYKKVSLTIRGDKSLYSIESPLEEGGIGRDPVGKKFKNNNEESIQSLISNYSLPSPTSDGASVGGGGRGRNIEESILRNETAGQRVIGLTVETRPEYVTDDNCQLRRRLGVTRLEIGIQSTNDEVLTMNKRGHSVEQCRQALHRLRQYGFKFSIHIMPGLYGSDPDKDLQTFKDIYSDPWFKPDEIKFYPTSVIPNTELYELYLAGKYKPIETSAIKDIITTTFRDIIPPYTRIKRLIRDIPSTEIVAGSSVTNLAQLMHEQLYKQWRNTDIARGLYKRLFDNYIQYSSINEYLSSTKQQQGNIQTIIIGDTVPDLQSDRAFVSLDTRSREIRHEKIHLSDTMTVIRHYESSVGDEYFISIETAQGYLYGFTRLLLPREGETIDYPGLGAGTALIRELHVYGQVSPLSLPTGQAGPRPGEEATEKEKNKVMGVSNPEIIIRAKQLRESMTPTEKILREALTTKSIGDTKRRRQHPMGNYIVDFCAVQKNLIIEMDGGYHNTHEQQEIDTIRDKYLQSIGFTIMRFTNDDIHSHCDDVLEKITTFCNAPTSVEASVGVGGQVQHTGVGKSVMAIAEQIASHHSYKRLSVIAGVGVRDYYRKLGYTLEGTYMVKELKVQNEEL